MPVWCGGMLESGIGRAHNIALSTLSALRCLAMSPLLTGIGNRHRRAAGDGEPAGTITAPTGCGIGFAVNEPFVDSLDSSASDGSFRVLVECR